MENFKLQSILSSPSFDVKSIQTQLMTVEESQLLELRNALYMYVPTNHESKNSEIINLQILIDVVGEVAKARNIDISNNPLREVEDSEPSM